VEAVLGFVSGPRLGCRVGESAVRAWREYPTLRDETAKDGTPGFVAFGMLSLVWDSSSGTLGISFCGVVRSTMGWVGG
jgi:hypothetical protein